MPLTANSVLSVRQSGPEKRCTLTAQLVFSASPVISAPAIPFYLQMQGAYFTYFENSFLALHMARPDFKAQKHLARFV